MSEETKKTPAKPSPAIDGKFKVVGVEPGIIVTKKFGDVDLRTVSLEQADLLVKAGFRYLEKVEGKTAAAEKK